MLESGGVVWRGPRRRCHSGRWAFLVVVILLGCRDLARRAVGQPRVQPVVVAVDVGADLPARLVEGLELLTPYAALLELAEPGLDERLGFGVAVAAAAVRDAVLGQLCTERLAGERGAVVGAERERAGLDPPVCDRLEGDGGGFLGATANVEAPAGDRAGAAVDDCAALAGRGRWRCLQN